MARKPSTGGAVWTKDEQPEGEHSLIPKEIQGKEDVCSRVGQEPGARGARGAIPEERQVPGQQAAGIAAYLERKRQEAEGRQNLQGDRSKEEVLQVKGRQSRRREDHGRKRRKKAESAFICFFYLLLF